MLRPHWEVRFSEKKVSFLCLFLFFDLVFFWGWSGNGNRLVQKKAPSENSEGASR